MHTCPKSIAVTSLSIIALLGCVAATAPTTQLAQLLTTNAPCRVRLQPAWTGDAKYTVRTGFFTNAQATLGRDQREQLRRELRFDWFTYSDKPSLLNDGPQTVSRSAGAKHQTGFYTQRRELPPDTAIQACTTILALEDLLGPPQGIQTGAPFSAGWTFFTLTPTNTIATLSVFSIRQRPLGEIDSLEIWRGIAKEER